MAARAIRRGLLLTVSKCNKKCPHRVLRGPDYKCGPDWTRARPSCLVCVLSSFRQTRFMSSRNRPDDKVLETVGVFEAPKQHGKYETGQLFLHSVFGYRGIVLFPWQARLYDRDVSPTPSDSKPESIGYESKEVKGKTHTYYQVLIDTRDCPHISQRSQTEAVTFLANHDDSRALYAIPGLDYVSHEDILPYSSTEQVPIQHELFERFLIFNPAKTPSFTQRDTLQAWQEKNHPWLELSDVHRETTENIRVTVIPFYMGMREAQNSYVYWVSRVTGLTGVTSDASFTLWGQLQGRGLVLLCLSGDTLSAWRTWAPKSFSSENVTGESSACRALWRQYVAEASLAGSQCCQRSNLRFSTAAMCLCRPLVAICGGHFALRGRTAPTSTYAFHLSRWRATRMTKLPLLAIHYNTPHNTQPIKSCFIMLLYATMLKHCISQSCS